MLLPWDIPLCASEAGQDHPPVAEPVLISLEYLRKDLVESRYLWSSPERQSYAIWTSRLPSASYILSLWISGISPASKNMTYFTQQLHRNIFNFIFSWGRFLCNHLSCVPSWRQLRGGSPSAGGATALCRVRLWNLTWGWQRMRGERCFHLSNWKKISHLVYKYTFQISTCPLQCITQPMQCSSFCQWKYRKFYDSSSSVQE